MEKECFCTGAENCGDYNCRIVIDYLTKNKISIFEHIKNISSRNNEPYSIKTCSLKENN